MAGLGIAAGLFAGQRHYMEMQRLQEDLDDRRARNAALAEARKAADDINARKRPPGASQQGAPGASTEASPLPPVEPVGPGSGLGAPAAAPSTGGGGGGGRRGKGPHDPRLAPFGPPPGQPATALPPGPSPDGKKFGRGIQSQPYADDATLNNDPASSGPYRSATAADPPERYGPDSSGAQMGVEAGDYMETGRPRATGAQMGVDASDNTGRGFGRTIQSQPYADDAAFSLSPDTSPYMSASAADPVTQGRPYELPDTTDTISASAADEPYGGNPSFLQKFAPAGVRTAVGALGALGSAADRNVARGARIVGRGLRNTPRYMLTPPQAARPDPPLQALPPSVGYAPQMDSRDPYAQTRTRRALDPRYPFIPPAYGN
jgi:hypothetical protein